ncbi:MAG: NAD(P)-dependent glycerol-3-phosphate dehydrogenase, partial [candidate division Zixibacteria bacterium]|nr:NAD(P)-dependent glycerol-3-phosphate dehydrogenase [candidate division Zixibacteria bacterium]
SITAVDYIVMAIPVQRVRQVCQLLDKLPRPHKGIINLAKGIEIDSLLRMSEVIKMVISGSDEKYIATLSGPSHAEEVAAKLPTTVVAASKNPEFAAQVQRIFNNKILRVYRSTDLIGVELGGSLKNVIAIASGITQGFGLGDNTMGALITRGLAEITRMGVRLGADPLTFSGLSGIGDLVTTCISRHSRNRYVGEKIGKGQKLKNVLEGMVMVAEGVDTCRSAQAMAEKYGVEMPITAEVYKVLFEDKPPDRAIAELMSRSLKEEIWN